MNLKSITASLCVAAMVGTSMPAFAAPIGSQPAQIDHRKRRYHRRKHRRSHRYYRRHRHDHGGAVALGLFGLAAGLAIAGSHNRHYSQPRRYHRSGSCRPWSRAWYDYCEWRYRTFNPRTGYYYYKPGRQRFCTC